MRGAHGLACPDYGPSSPLRPPPLAGDGWSARVEDAVLHGCIPLIIMDNVSGVGGPSTFV